MCNDLTKKAARVNERLLAVQAVLRRDVAPCSLGLINGLRIARRPARHYRVGSGFCW